MKRYKITLAAGQILYRKAVNIAGLLIELVNQPVCIIERM
jgi:hypothetical protein